MKTATTVFIEFMLLELNVFLEEARKNGTDCATTELKLTEAKSILLIAVGKEKNELKMIITELEQMHQVCSLRCEIADDDDSDCGV